MAYYCARTEFPQQVSTDQASEGLSEIAFSNGATCLSMSGVNGHRFVRNGILNEQLQLTYTRSAETSTATRRQPPTAKHPDYTDYSERFRSYARWSRSNPSPVCLSEAGFFFTNQGDLVRCFQCGIGLKDFSEGDDPLMEHVRYSGNCLYLLEHLGTATLSAMKKKCQTEQVEGIGQQQSNAQCRHPEYKCYEVRLSSFGGWPQYLTQRPEALAEAGLYYTGSEDHVRCFMCDGGLRRWDTEDDPWTEHCRWFPACQYAREKKGEEFIALVQASAEYNEEETETTTQGEIADSEAQMTLGDPEFRAVLDEHKNACLEMGYELADFNAAVEDLRNMGQTKHLLNYNVY